MLVDITSIVFFADILHRIVWKEIECNSIEEAGSTILPEGRAIGLKLLAKME